MTSGAKSVLYRREREMYPEVVDWFRRLLSSRHRQSEVTVFDTSQVSLWQFLKRQGLHHHFSDYLSYEIQVDITGVIRSTVTLRN